MANRSFEANNRSAFRHRQYARGAYPKPHNHPFNQAYGAPPPLIHTIHPSNAYACRIGRFDRHLTTYVTRYQDLFLRIRRYPEAEVLSCASIDQLSLELGPEGGFHVASARLLYGTYERCSPLQQRIPAMETLRLWAEYLQAHLDYSVPSPRQELLEQRMAEQAEATAQSLWDEYQNYVVNPIRWGEAMVQQENWRLFRELETAGNEQHRLWLEQNIPNLLPAPPKVSKLRASAPEFPYPSKRPQKVKGIEIQSRDGSVPDTSFTSADHIDRSNSTNSSLSTTPSLSRSQSTDASELSSQGALQEVEDRMASLSVATSELSSIDGEGQISRSGNDALDSPLSVDFAAAKTEKQRTADSNPVYDCTIMLLSHDTEMVPVKAMLDTGNRGPNFVSYELVVKLHRHRDILMYHKSKDSPVFIDASHNEIQSMGVIKLSFYFFNREDPHRYEKWHNKEEFNVLPSDHIQVNFGAPYITRMELLKFDNGALTPLTADRKANSSLKLQIADNKSRRDAKKKENERQRMEMEAMQDSHDSSNTAGVKNKERNK